MVDNSIQPTMGNEGFSQSSKSSRSWLKLPKRLFARYQAIRSELVRRIIAGCALLVILAAAFLVYFFTQRHAAVAGPGKELCEFLARPAAKLYIDGELVSEEIPPIYRTRLEDGTHAIRFVSPEDRAHEDQINVVVGQPKQWVMNFVTDSLSERPLSEEQEQ